jgi:hypothetical protein
MTWVIKMSDADISSQTLAYTVGGTSETLVLAEFCNRSTSATATIQLWVVPSAESVGNEHLKESGTQLGTAGLSSAVFARKVIAPAGAKIYVQASNANVSCQVSGDETAVT